MSLFCFTAASGSIPLSLVKGCTFGTFCVQDKKGGDFMLNFHCYDSRNRYNIYELYFYSCTFNPVPEVSSEKALEQTHQKSVSAMYSSDFCLCHPDFLCRVHLYTSKLLTFCRQRFLSAYQGTVLFLDFLPFCAISSESGSSFYAHPMGIHHLLSYNIRIKHVSEVNLYETETNPLPILWQHRNFKGCVLCIWK